MGHQLGRQVLRSKKRSMFKSLEFGWKKEELGLFECGNQWEGRIDGSTH